MSEIAVLVDDRVRLMSMLLAATTWPDQAQARHPHGIYSYTRIARHHVLPLRDHLAVQMLQYYLDQGAPLDALFGLATYLKLPTFEADDWPTWAAADWPAALHDFYTVANLSQWWQREDALWRKSLNDTQAILRGANLKTFFQQFFGDIHVGLVFMPNIGEPTAQPVNFWSGYDAMTIVPPRLAWGTNPPWPFDEDAAYVYRAALTGIGDLLLRAYLDGSSDLLAHIARLVGSHNGAGEDAVIALLLSAMTTIYLADHVSKAEADAYALMERKTRAMPRLPEVIHVVRRYLAGQRAGRYTQLVEFLPVFPDELRQAQRLADP